MRILIAFLFGLLLLSTSVQAKKVYSDTEYRPPDYDVGHPELISEAKVLLTEEELEKESYNIPRKIAAISISQGAVETILSQAEDLLPENPSKRAGDGQSTALPPEQLEYLYWKREFDSGAPILNLQVTLKKLSVSFDQLEITSISKWLSTFKKDATPRLYINIEAPNLKGAITFQGGKLEKIYFTSYPLKWQIFADTINDVQQYYFYRLTYRKAVNDSITPNPEEVRKNLERYDNLNSYHPIPHTIGVNPKRIDVYFIYEPGFNTQNISRHIEEGVKKFNKLLNDASGPSSFFIHSLGYGPAPALTCKPHNDPCNNLHSFNEVLEAMRESSTMTQLRREPYKQADLIIMFRTNIEIGDIGDPSYLSEWSIYGKSYTPPSPVNAKNFKWSVGAVSGNQDDATVEAIAHEIGHLLNANHSKDNPDYASRDKSNPNNALNVAYHHLSSTCPAHVLFGVHTFMAYKEVCDYKYRNVRPSGCPPVNCRSVDRFSENGAMVSSPSHSEVSVSIGSASDSNFSVMNYYAHYVSNYSVEAQKSLPPVAKISRVQGNNKRWEKQCWNGATSEMNSGVFHNAKWWVLVDGTIQISDSFYNKEQSFCYRPLSNKQHTVKLRVTRLDNFSHTTEFSFVPELPVIDKFNVSSDLAYVNVNYGFTGDIQPPTLANYHIYEKDYSHAKPSFRNIKTTSATSASFFRASSLGERLDYKVKICAAVGDCSADSAVRTVFVDLWAALIGDTRSKVPAALPPLIN